MTEATDDGWRRLRVEHETRYRYDARVDVAHHLALLTPPDDERQRLERFRLTIHPAPAQLHQVVDPYGNRRTLFSLFTPHRELVVTARSVVLVRPSAPPRAASSTDWRELREALRYATGRPFVPEAEFVFGTALAPHSNALRDYAAQSFGAAAPVHLGALDLMHRIHRDFRYAPATTAVSTPAPEAFRLRQGVCQDFAHVMISACRSIGLAARYVSGYLVTRPVPGRPRLVGADASHAWVSVFCPRNGWLDLDPTNDRPAGEDHVELARGRDYADVPPLRGVIRGGGAHVLQVAVGVEPVADELPELSQSGRGAT